MEKLLLVIDVDSGLLKHTETSDVEMKKPLVVTCSSDRGLCGGIHSSLAKMTKRTLNASPEATNAVLGVKARSKLQYDYAKQIVVSFDGVCKYPPSWYESSTIADGLLKLEGSSPDGYQVVFNRFKSVIAFETSSLKLPTQQTIASARNLNLM
jgi:F-type H+-transporting ATPase subunit gamma